MDADLAKLKAGWLRDHTGKRSNSRVVSFFSISTLCIIAIGTTFIPGADIPPDTLLYILAGGAVAPVGINRFLGEAGAPKEDSPE